MEQQTPLEVKVWGDFACFTRPEMKAERASHPVPTPSAARGILEAIFWKPQFAWRVQQIWVLRPIRFLSILRNEVNTTASARAVASWTKSGGGFYATEDRAQRNSLILRDVAYVFRADIALRPGVLDDPAKYRDQFRRRVRRGQYFHCPCLGCREFAAHFGPPAPTDRPLPDLDLDIGSMLFDLAYRRDDSGKGIGAEPVFFNAALRGGVLDVPRDLYDKTEADHAPATTP